MKRSKIALLVVTFFVASLFSVSAFALPADSVLSHDIKEADGTSGQDTNNGSGVKTGHIQDGAVTDAKITGPISTSKLNVGTTAGTVAAGDHNHDGVYQKKYARVAVVALSGGDYTSPDEATQHWQEWCSVTPCLLKIMPGRYAVSNAVVIGDQTDIEGSGRASTKIVSSSGAAILQVGGSSDVRNITVENNNGSGTDIAGIDSFGTLRLTQVDIITAGVNTRGVRNFDYGYAVLNDVIIYTNGTGIAGMVQSNCGTGPVLELHDVKIRPNEWPNPGTMVAAIEDNACSTYHGIIIKDSEIWGNIIAGSGVDVKVVNTLLGGSLTGAGSFKIVNSYDSGYNPIPNQ